MADLLTLEVATPLGLALRTECEAVSAPSVYGEFGVLPNHVPLLAALKCGMLKYRVEGRDHVAAIGAGFVSAGPEKVELLTDVFALPEDIDVDSARKELGTAEESLKSTDHEPDSPEYKELLRNGDWAQARIDVFEESDK